MTNIKQRTAEFFQHYAEVLLARDEAAIAEMYGTPSLILFPGNVIAVESTDQTAQFFGSSWEQYEGVDTAESRIDMMGEAPGTVWADVTWSYGGEPRERFCYQLVEEAGSYRIAVLTPMQLV